MLDAVSWSRRRRALRPEEIQAVAFAGRRASLRSLMTALDDADDQIGDIMMSFMGQGSHHR
jgi:hypothetical protein